MTKRQRELVDRLDFSEALLSRTDLAELGLPRRGVDAVFRALDVVVLPGYSRPMVRVRDYLHLVERSTYAMIGCARDKQKSCGR